MGSVSSLGTGSGGGGGGGNVATDAIWDAKGDLAVGTGSNTSQKLVVSATNDTFLVTASGETTGLKWTNTILELVIRGATSALRIYNRATDTETARWYSATAGKLNLYHVPTSQDIFTIDSTEAIFFVAPKVGTDNTPYDATAWNGSLKLVTENAVRDKIETMGGGTTIATDTIWDAKGDMAIATGSDAAAKLTVGANDTFHVADTAAATGTKWTDTIKSLLIRGATSSVRLYNRDVDTTSIQLYSPTTGKFAIYTDLGGANVVEVSNTLFQSFVQALFGKASFVAGVAADIPIISKGAASQTGNLQEWQNSAGTILAHVTSVGGLRTDSVHSETAANMSLGATAGGETFFVTSGSEVPMSIQTNRRVSLFTPRFPIGRPAQITANQNNYAPMEKTPIQYLTSDASRNITGLVVTHGAAANQEGDIIELINTGSFDIVLKHQDALSTAANRFICSTAADITLTAGQGADAHYDGTAARWRVFKRN